VRLDLASVVVLLAWGAPARAQQSERTSSLSWVRMTGAEACVGTADLARAVEHRLGRRVFVSAASAEIAVEGHAERAAGGSWRAVIRVTDAHGTSLGERVVESRAGRCDELGELVTAAIAVTIDPLTPVAETAHEPAADHDPSSDARAPPSAQSPPGPERVVVRTERVVVERPGPRWQIEIDGSLAGAIGMLPDPTAGLLSAVIIVPPRFVPLVLESALFPIASVQAPEGDADLVQMQAGLAICPLAIGGRVALHACAGVDAGAVLVAGGSLELAEKERLIVQAHAEARVHWRVVGPLVLRAGLHLLVPFRRDDVLYTDSAGASRTLYTPPVVAGMLDLGAGLRFDW